MTTPALLSKQIEPARNHAQQLKMAMNLPVRLVSENEIIDIYPIEPDPSLYVKRKKAKSMDIGATILTLDELIAFFQGLLPGSLLTIKEVAYIYNINIRTVSCWAAEGRIKRHRLSNSLTVFKKSELPSLEMIYN